MNLGIKLEYGPEFDATSPAAKWTIKTKDGRALSKPMDYARGTPENRVR